MLDKSDRCDVVVNCNVAAAVLVNAISLGLGESFAVLSVRAARACTTTATFTRAEVLRALAGATCVPPAACLVGLWEIDVLLN